MSYWQYYQPNPNHDKVVGDCTIRAMTKALDMSWDDVYVDVCAYGYDLKDMPSANHVWGKYLRNKGFHKHHIDDYGENIYTVEDFCRDHPTGTYLLAIDGHLVCVKDGFYYDAWDSGQEIPVYYWERKEG